MSVRMHRPARCPDDHQDLEELFITEPYRPAAQPEQEMHAQPLRLQDIQRLGASADDIDPDAPSDDSALLDIDAAVYVPPSKPEHLATEAPALSQEQRSDGDAVMRGLDSIETPEPVQTGTADIAEPINTVTAAIGAARLDDFRESEREPEAATSPGCREKRVASINRKYWGKHQQLDRDRRSELKAHGEQGYRLPEAVLTSALRTRLDDLDSTDGIDKELKAAGVPEHRAGSVKTNTASCMKAALANVANHPNMQMIREEPLTKGSIRSSESVGAVMTNIRRSGLIARELSALRADVDDLNSRVSVLEASQQAMQQASARQPSSEERALALLQQGLSVDAAVAELQASGICTIKRSKLFQLKRGWTDAGLL